MSAVLYDLELSGLRVPSNRPDLKRDRHGKAAHHDAAFDARYDWHTLFYDCFSDPVAGEILLLGPPLMNFQPLIETAEFHLDGRPVEIKEIREMSRCSIVALDAAEGQLLTVRHQDFGGNLPVGKSFADDFAGFNGIYSISLNNRLNWIADWLQYYVRVHGLETVVLTDNGSTTYSPQALADTIASVPGLKQAVILRARFPFGPTAENRSAYNSLFLQRSMAEMGRLRFFPKARAVLNADIDELFYSDEGTSIFDATVASESGYIRANAEWVYAPNAQFDRFSSHASHTHVSASGKPKANRKWCVVPDGPQSGKQWLTHFINDKKDPVDPRFRMWHFRDVSTGWKYDRSAAELGLTPNPELIDAMRRSFPEQF